jgi:hypothetical protein
MLSVMNINETIKINRVGFGVLIKGIILAGQAQEDGELTEDHLTMVILIAEKLLEEAIVGEFAEKIGLDPNDL